jgi:dTDP-glucose pyrophosphorylase
MPSRTTRSAVILARGLGTRMRRADTSAVLDTGQTAAADRGMKGMIPIGRPFLDYSISALADAGYERVCLVIGPEHKAAVHYYNVESPPMRVSLEFAVQDNPLGTADAVLAAEPFCGTEPFVVLNSDNYYPADALLAIGMAPAPAIAGFSRRSLMAEGNVPPDRVQRFGALTIDDDGYLVSIVPRAGDASARGDEVYASMNCWLFDARIFAACRRVDLSPRNELELPRAVQLGIDAMGMRFKVLKLDVPVLDMSTRGDISGVQQRLKGVNVRP